MLRIPYDRSAYLQMWKKMRTSLFAVAFGLLMLYLAAFVGAALAYQRCLLCGMDVDKSETAFYVKMASGRMYPLCSFQCVYMLMMNTKEKAASVRTEDYSTCRLINAKTAYFLCESRLIPKGSMVPYILAFASKDKAEEYKKKYGGRVLDFDGAMEIVKKSMMKKK
jgi:nitrous oxide reductase accessory protein NosL